MKRYFALMLGFGLVTLGLRAGSAADEGALKPVNIANVNTDRDEDDPHVGPSGLVLFYASVTKEKSGILVSRRSRTTFPWSPGKEEFPELNGHADYRSVFLTADGRYPQLLYYATNKDPEKGEKGSNFDIYFLIKEGPRADFTSESAMPAVDTQEDELDPWMTLDGRFFFSRHDKDGWHVYVTTRPRTGGQFTEPVQVQLPVGFRHATLTPDGKTIYLQGPLAKDRLGLFRTTFVEGKWTDPEQLTALNNADGPTGDRSPCLNRDGTMLYFSSDRPGGKGGLDLWVIPTAQLSKK